MWIGVRTTSHHDVFQFHVQHVGTVNVLLPVVVVLYVLIHVVQDQLKEDDLLRYGAERVVKAKRVISVLRFNSRGNTSRSVSNAMRMLAVMKASD